MEDVRRERKNAQNKAFMIRKLVNMKYKDGTSVAEHLSSFQDVVNQVLNMNIKIDDELQALLLLSSLPDSWEILVISLSNSAPNGKVTMQMVKDSMLNEERRRKEQGTSTQGEALVTEGRSKTRNSPINSNWSQSRGKSKSRKNVECFYCKRPGHVIKECRKLKRDQANENGDRKKEEKETTALASDVDLSILCDDGYVNLTCQDSTWIVDSGASFHITSNKDFFSSGTSGDFGSVRMGNEAASKVVDLCLETGASFS